jgi:hypothetical protein
MTMMWARGQNIYKRIKAMTPSSVGLWWWLLIVFLTAFLADLFRRSTPGWIHIPIGITLLLIISISLIRERFVKRKNNGKL